MDVELFVTDFGYNCKDNYEIVCCCWLSLDFDETKWFLMMLFKNYTAKLILKFFYGFREKF